MLFRSGRIGDAPVIGGASNNNGFCDKQITRLANIDFERRFRDLLEAARRGNVAFYPVDMGGLKTFAPTASMSGNMTPARMNRMLESGQSGVTMLKVLAENTDGEAVVNSNDVGIGLKRIADDLSAYYLIGYASTNAAMDGKYRRIEVKTNVPKVSLTARRGYSAPSPAGVALAKAAAAAVAVPVEIAEPFARLSRLRTDADVFGYAVRSAAGLDVVAEISAQEVERGRWAKGADAHVTVARANGEPVTAVAKLDPGARGVVVRVPLPADASISSLKVKISTAADAIDGEAEAPDKTAAATLVGDPIGFRGATVARIPLRPVADFQFRRSERLHVEWPVLKPLDQRTARILDRKGNPLAIAVAATEITSAQWSVPVVAADLTLAALAEADYLLELTAGAGAQTERKLFAFRVVR